MQMNDTLVMSVASLTNTIKSALENNLLLQNIWVKGELSNFKRHTSGHLYFTLKDDLSSIRCVMFRSKANKINVEPKHGDRVIVKGSVSVYERDGTYQLYVEDIRLEGIGDLHILFEETKKRLADEGLFDERYKKKLPVLPRKIGIVTSPTGAAIRDILQIIRRRFYNSHIIISPCRVQGDAAPQEIADAISNIQRVEHIDVIILGRGGGSFEELNAFNSEMVARAIFNCKTPIISAVGHETDFTISDFVADMRAPTPSAAAEIAVPVKADLFKLLQSYETKAQYQLRRFVQLERRHVIGLNNRQVISKPTSHINRMKQMVDGHESLVQWHIKRIFENRKNAIISFASKLDALSPLKILARGYTVTHACNGTTILRSIQQVSEGDDIYTTLQDGVLASKVTKRSGGESNEC
jgi:exodeoxyribonuclease VII large subunit